MSIEYFYINLSHRTDRNRSILKQFSNFNITNYTRIDAIKENNGHVGCSKSHILALTKFIESNTDIGIFLEDDFKFTINKEQYHNVINHILDFELSWDVVLISGNILNKRSYNQFLDVCLESQSTSGYIVKQKFATTLLSNYTYGLQMLESTRKATCYAIDQHWKILQKKHNWFVTNPKCGKQSSGYSDIEKRYVRYGC